MATRFYNTLAHEMETFTPLQAGPDEKNPLARKPDAAYAMRINSL